MKNRESGITLVSLAVTIIVMIILAAVAINLSIGDGGILELTGNTVGEYENATDKEQEGLQNFVDEFNAILNGDGETGEEPGGDDTPISEKPDIEITGWNTTGGIVSISTISGYTTQYRIGSSGQWSNYSTTVNVRKEASKDSEIIAQISQNTAVEVISDEGGWAKVKVNGKEGYIASNLLSDKKTEVTTSSRGSNETRKPNTENKTTTSTPGKGATVVETAKKYIGYSYKYGASGPTSFDCSGFTSYIFKLHGVSLSRTAKQQYGNGTAVSRSDLQPGDLIMFGPSVSGINHVGIYIGGGQIVHAANPSRGVTIDTINSGYYNNNYVGARRVI